MGPLGLFAIHKTTAIKSFPLVNWFTTSGRIFGPRSTRAANSGPEARVAAFAESLLLLLNHVFFQAAYLSSKSLTRVGDVVLSLVHTSLVDFTAAALGAGTGAKGFMRGAFLYDEDDEADEADEDEFVDEFAVDGREAGGEEEAAAVAFFGGAAPAVGGTAPALAAAAAAELLLAGPVF